MPCVVLMNMTPLPTSMLIMATLLSACAAPQVSCTNPARVADLPPVLLEASGIAVSRRHADVIWVHNDSEGTPLLHALDRDARRLAEIALPGALAQSDWEDIAIGPCPAGDCLYIGDIGDNLHDRTDRAILRVAEPSLDGTVPLHVERFPFAYPDGPEDAEALFVTPDTIVFVITKGRRQPVTLFRYPPPLRADRIVMLEPVQQLSAGIAQLPDLVTGADATADGFLIAIRTYTTLHLYRFAGDTLRTVLPGGVSLTPLGEPQGEGVAFGAGDTLLLVTETGPQRATPFLSRLGCSLR
jgi:hypothetical protein